MINALYSDVIFILYNVMQVLLGRPNVVATN